MEGDVRLSTGISALDNISEGGFLQNTINMVEGDAGTGKTTFCMHFLFAGLEAGEKCVFITIDETKKSLYRNMGRFGFDLKKYEENGQLLFLELNPQKMRDSIEKGLLGIEDKLGDKESKRLLIDNVTALSLLYDTEVLQRSAVHSLFQKIKLWGLTSLVISEASTENSQFGLKYLVDGWIKLNHKKLGQERLRSLELLKMRGTIHETTEMVYRIEPTGISLYPDERILRD